MTVTSQAYAKARVEIITLFGWNADSLSPDQTLRVDCAVALRLALDDLQGRIVRGESADVARMLTASEALARLLPATVLANPPSEQRADTEAMIAPLRRLYRNLHEQVHALTHENVQLRARLGLPASGAGTGLSENPVAAITPAEVVPPSEWRGETYAGVKPGPDDPPKPVTIDAKAVKRPEPQPTSWDETDNGKKWRAWVDAGSPGGGDPWADNRG
jgi:hypothetical protein